MRKYRNLLFLLIFFSILPGLQADDLLPGDSTMHIKYIYIQNEQSEAGVVEHGEVYNGQCLSVTLDRNAELLITIYNDSNEDITLTSASGEDAIRIIENGEFFLIDNYPVSNTIPPGESVSFSIYFLPMILGEEKRTRVLIEDDSSPDNPFEFGLWGLQWGGSGS